MSRPCAFLDRDGVINRKAPDGDYIRTWAEFELIPSIVDWIRFFNLMDLLVIVVTNQRGVARGLVDPADLADIHTRMREQLRRAGAHLDDVLCCPHEEGTCECRKPRPGLVLQAQRAWNIDLSRSLMLGDSERDRQLAANCGLRFVRVDEGRIVDVEHFQGSLPDVREARQR